ncbi:MAG TPA: ATP-grasp domain-containing protein [Pirellulales bacterium]|nr:ATP-grasp domain-containing protein [Pirellulales bacterium]
MKIGITFNVKFSGEPTGPGWQPTSGGCQGLADDGQEEFDSPETILALHNVLQELGHEVQLLGDGEELLHRLLAGPRPELVLNIAEGSGTSRSREARVPAVLEMLGVPHTGSDPLTLAAALDKDCAKRLVQGGGVATPDWVLVSGLGAGLEERLDQLPLPVIVKPAFEGSSKGILEANLIFQRAQLYEAVVRLWQAYRQPILVEEFVDGDELTVGLIGNESPEIIGVMRVVPQQQQGPFVYSLEVKRDWQRRVRYECPARLSAADTRAVREAALASWRALGCRDVARIDFRLRDHVPYFLEANPLPGLSPTSGDLVLLAGHVGIGYPELISRILAAAVERLGNSATSPAAMAIAGAKA